MRDIRLGHAEVLAGRTRVALRLGESDGGTPQMDAKKRAELREAVVAARRNLIKDEPSRTGKTVDTDRQLELLKEGVLAIADYILESDVDVGTF